MADQDKTIFTQFKESLIRKGLEYFGKYYGVYRGSVVDNADPMNLGRLKIKCPQLYGDQTPNYWAMGRGIIAGRGHGVYWIPSKDDPILISCENGDPRFPLWEHGWWLKDQMPENAELGNYVFTTPKGQRIELDDNLEKTIITGPDGQTVVLNNDGTLDLLGTDDNAVRYSPLKDGYDKTTDALDAIINILTGVPINEPGNGAPSALQASLSAALAGKNTGDISGAKIDEIKTS